MRRTIGSILPLAINCPNLQRLHRTGKIHENGPSEGGQHAKPAAFDSA